jgi:hydroxymethylpyrimidine/phosphomethylpyrimidine kinase
MRGFANYLKVKHILVIAGSDSSGGAGIQADIKTITSLGGHALTALTAVTAQNSLGVTGIHKIPAGFISRQVKAVIEEVLPQAVKIGMLYSGAAVKEVAKLLKRYGLSNIVLDPVLRATTGKELLEPEAVSLLKEELLPLASVVTPNLFEAGTLAGMKVDCPDDMEKAAETIQAMGPDVVITGGHLKGQCTDLLFDGKAFHRFHGSRIDTQHTHGSGCVFSTSLASFLGGGKDVVTATKMAHDFTRRAIIYGYECGRGPGPVKPG